ncbi:MAG: zinc-ribbon domain-containing protein, partial [Thermoguttaceae bacterium]|nr:zinc-ribbon domain-containing protein [Thermoguttaceae bacterium]
MFCSNCGSNVAANSAFCPICGTIFNQGSGPAYPPQNNPNQA